MNIVVQIPDKIKPVFEGKARYRGAYGGRGSGKTRSFATMCVIKALEFAYKDKINGTIMCARESMKSLKDSSMSEIKNSIKDLKLDEFFIFGLNYIRTANGLIEFIFDGLKQNVDSIKSKSRILICWIDEAESISENSWQTLIPTIREDASEIWITWNPKIENSATDRRFKKVVDTYHKSINEIILELNSESISEPQKLELKKRLKAFKSQLSNYKIVSINWSDNPWFPKTLDKERLTDLERDTMLYQHIWEGEYVKVAKGSYFSDYLYQAKNEQRIGYLARDTYKPLYAFWDLGGTGTRSDATAIWIAQFVEKEIRVLDYYEVQGQPLSAHINWLRDNNYEKGTMVLPHDGATNDRVNNVSFQSELIRAGFKTDLVKNQGSGAAMARINACRKWFNRMFFDEVKTESGRKALEWYHENWDDVRNIGLGACHDWSSHAADAFGLMAIYYKEPNNSVDNYGYYTPARRNSSWAGI